MPKMWHEMHLLFISPKHAMEEEELVGANDGGGLTSAKDCEREDSLDVPQGRVDNGFGSLVV